MAFLGSCLFAQAAGAATGSDPVLTSQAVIPDAPTPQVNLAALNSEIAAGTAGPPSGQAQNAQPPAQNNAGQSSSTQQPAADPDPPAAGANGSSAVIKKQNCPNGQNADGQPCDENQRQKAEQEVQEEEKQRVEGVVPTFNVTYRHDAVPLNASQKMSLSLRSAVDPFAFAAAFLSAGYHEADDDLVGFDWGAKGYFERVGVNYLDNFDSTILSNGVFPIVFRQDPRYHRMGPGPTIKHRILYSLATNFIALNDYNGKWGPNYGNILGNFAAGEISNFYYPAGNSSVGLAATNTAVQIVEGAGGSIFNEFWPDLSRRFLHKDPTHGLDAQQEAEERQNKNSNAGPK
jgi:hypothetical protein